MRKYPALFDNLGVITDILIEYPYFLPCFVATCISIICWLLVFFFAKETLYLKKKIDSEQQPLLVQEHSETSNDISFKEMLTPQVMAISIIYALVAFQMLYYDGKYSHYFFIGLELIFY